MNVWGGQKAETKVLMYHGIGCPASHGEENYTIPVDNFISQLDIIRQHPVLTYNQFVAGEAAPAGSVVITFDDGERSVITTALPLMRERGLTGAVFMTTGWIGQSGYLTVDDLKLLKEAGWTIGTHGVTHRLLSDLPAEEIRLELEESRRVLADIIQEEPQHLALPGGRGNRSVTVAAQALGYCSIGTSIIGSNPVPPDLYHVRRIMMLRAWNLEMFRQILDGHPWPYFYLRFRQGVLDFAKQSLGNRRYVAVRHFLLQAKRFIHSR